MTFEVGLIKGGSMGTSESYSEKHLKELLERKNYTREDIKSIFVNGKFIWRK